MIRQLHITNWLLVMIGLVLLNIHKEIVGKTEGYHHLMFFVFAAYGFLAAVNAIGSRNNADA